MCGALQYVICLLGAVQGANILGIFPHSGISHWMCFKPVMEELANRGHQVTVVSVYPRENPLPNYVDISLRPSYPESKEDGRDVEAAVSHSIAVMVGLFKMGGLAENTLNQKEVLDLAEQKFDLVIMEFFHTDIYHALAHKIDAPVVGISSHPITQWAAETLRHPDEPSYAPHILSFLKAPFTFWQRLENTITLHISQFVYKHIFVTRAHNTAEKALGEMPYLEDLARNTTLLLVNSHFTINNPRPWNPNIIEVGGINVLPINPLPQVSYEIA